MRTSSALSFLSTVLFALGLSACAVAPAGDTASDPADPTAAADEGHDDESIDQSESGLELALIDRCGDSKKRKLRAAERLARYITSPGIIEIYTRAKLPNGQPNYLYFRFFDSDSTWNERTAERVRAQFARIHAKLEASDSVVRCRAIRACNDSSTNAWVNDWRGVLITFCPAYFDRAPSYRAAVWVHELSHELLGTNDDVYGTPPSSLHELSSRVASYPQVARFVDEGGSNAAEQFEAFTVNLMGQFFSDLWYAQYRSAITGAQLAQVLENVGAGRDPFDNG